MMFLSYWLLSTEWQVAQSSGVTTTWTLYPLCSKVSVCLSGFLVWHAPQPPTVPESPSAMLSVETLLSRAVFLRASAGVTPAWRLFSQSATIPGVTETWHPMHPCVGSLCVGAANAGTAVTRTDIPARRIDGRRCMVVLLSRGFCLPGPSCRFGARFPSCHIALSLWSVHPCLDGIIFRTSLPILDGQAERMANPLQTKGFFGAGRGLARWADTRPRLVLPGGMVYHHLDRMFPAVVDEGNCLVGLRNSINGHARLAFPGKLLQDIDFVDRLAIPVVHLECLPVRGGAR